MFLKTGKIAKIKVQKYGSRLYLPLFRAVQRVCIYPVPTPPPTSLFSRDPGLGHAALTHNWPPRATEAAPMAPPVSALAHPPRRKAPQSAPQRPVAGRSWRLRTQARFTGGSLCTGGSQHTKPHLWTWRRGSGRASSVHSWRRFELEAK